MDQELPDHMEISPEPTPEEIADLYSLHPQPPSYLHPNPNMDAPNNYVDPELLVDAENEKDSVVTINADSDGEPPLRADDCES